MFQWNRFVEHKKGDTMEGPDGSQVQRFLVLKAFLTRIGLLVDHEAAFDHEAVLERGVTELLLMHEGYTKILAPLIWFAAWFKRHRAADLKLTPEDLLLIDCFSDDHATAIKASSGIMIRLRNGDPEAKRELALLLKVARYVSQAERRSRQEKKRREGGANGASSLQ